MKIRTEAGTIEVELGTFVFDESSDTFTTWDNLEIYRQVWRISERQSRHKNEGRPWDQPGVGPSLMVTLSIRAMVEGTGG